MVATKNDWKRVPFTTGVPIPLRGVFSHAELDRIREGLVPVVMEDKWFVYFEQPHLFLHRSWTGQPVYRVALIETSDGASVEEALCVAEQVERTGPEHQAELLDFLIGNLLLGSAKPFPVPVGITKQESGLLQHAIAGTAYPTGDSRRSGGDDPSER